MLRNGSPQKPCLMPWVIIGSVLTPITALPARTETGTAEFGTSCSVTSVLASSFHFASR